MQRSARPFTKGAPGAILLLGASIVFWIVLPVAAALRRIRRIDF